MSEQHGDFQILSKMEPMARLALASMEAMEKAIIHNNRDDIEKNLETAQNALSKLRDDLNLHDNLTKAFNAEQADTRMGGLHQYKNTDSDYDGTEGAVVLGVSRKGRSTTVMRPHRVW